MHLRGSVVFEATVKAFLKNLADGLGNASSENKSGQQYATRAEQANLKGHTEYENAARKCDQHR